MTRDETIAAIRELPEGKCIGYWREEKCEYRDVGITTDALKVLADSVPRWTPVSERLPKKWETVIVTSADGTVMEAWVDDRVWRYFDGLELYPEPFAWMPLPSPYQEDKQND